MLRTLLGLLSLLLVAPLRPSAAQSGACRSLDADAEDHRAYVLRINASAAAGPREFRARLRLAPVPADSVTWVTAAATCQRAAAAYAKIFGPSTPGWDGVHVLRLGPLLVIGRPDGHAGGLLLVADAVTFERRDLWSR